MLNLINNIDSTIQRTPETKLYLKQGIELEGYQYEGAESSFEIVIRKILKVSSFLPAWEFKVMVNEPSISGANSSAMIKINGRAG